MEIQTQRLLLRQWREGDAKAVYEYAKSPEIGPAAGWPVHFSVENSRDIIVNVLTAPEYYAVTKIENPDHVIGSIGIMIGAASNLDLPEDEGEIGYWIGKPYWGQGLIPEATRALIQRGFESLGLKKIWCGYFGENIKSKRVQEKCGFLHVRTEETYWELIDETKTQHITCITAEQWKHQSKFKWQRRIMMKYSWLEAYCLSKVGATMDYKLEWEVHRFMVGGKMFAMKGKNKERCPIFTLKLAPANGEAMRQTYAEIVPGYYSNKVHWNSVDLSGDVPDDVFQSLIDEAHGLVLASLPKKLQKEILEAD